MAKTSSTTAIVFKMAFIVLLSSSVALSQLQTCGSFLTQTDCGTNTNCQWSASTATACSQPKQCSTLQEVACISADNQEICSWNKAVAASCAVNPEVCTLNADSTDCATKDNCSFVASTPAQCNTVGQSFGCQNILTAGDCTQQCTWSTGSCAPTTACQSYSYANCPTQCTATQSCKVSQDAPTICSNFSDADCVSSGCVLTSPGLCEAPTSCKANQDGTCPTLCTASIGSCQAKASTCNLTTQATCTAANTATVNYCAWTGNSVCNDTAGYCANAADCANAAPYCTSVPIAPAQCVPNKTTNVCNNLSQADCTSAPNSATCMYTTGQAASCSNKEANCAQYSNQAFCQDQTACQWGNVYSCTDKATPTPDAHSMTLVFSLAALLVMLAF